MMSTKRDIQFFHSQILFRAFSISIFCLLQRRRNKLQHPLKGLFRSHLGSVVEARVQLSVHNTPILLRAALLSTCEVSIANQKNQTFKYIERAFTAFQAQSLWMG